MVFVCEKVVGVFSGRVRVKVPAVFLGGLIGR
jgi:hypothetical protein